MSSSTITAPSAATPVFVSMAEPRLTAKATWSVVSESFVLRSVPAGPVKFSLAKYTIQFPVTTIGALASAAFVVVRRVKPESLLLDPQPASERNRRGRTGRPTFRGEGTDMKRLGEGDGGRRMGRTP